MVQSMAGSPIKHERARIAREAILIALQEGDKTPEQVLAPGMRKIADSANEGDLGAMSFIRDTLDGKPAQQVALTGADDGPVRLVVSKEDAGVL